jgi:predicted nucleic acid-binding protein
VKILLDTNIVLDYALVRQPFYDLADRIFARIEQKQIIGYVSASTVSDLYYIIRKPRGKEWTLKFLQQLSDLCQIATINSETVKKALDNHYKDFEDDLQYYVAVYNNLDALVTRNCSDFPANALSILTPEQLLAKLEHGFY